MDKFPQTLINVPVAKQLDWSNESRVQTAVKAIEARLATTGRVLLRPSGTEPVVRVMVEGEDGATIEAAAKELADVVAASAAQ